MVRITRESWSRKLMMEIRRRRGSSALQRLRVSRKDNQVGGGSFSPSLLRHLPQIQDTNPDMPMCAPPTLYPSPGCRLRPRLHPTVPGSNPLWRGLCVSSRAPLPGDRACHLLPPRRPPPRPFQNLHVQDAATHCELLLNSPSVGFGIWGQGPTGDLRLQAGRERHAEGTGEDSLKAPSKRLCACAPLLRAP